MDTITTSAPVEPMTVGLDEPSLPSDGTMTLDGAAGRKPRCQTLLVEPTIPGLAPIFPTVLLPKAPTRNHLLLVTDVMPHPHGSARHRRVWRWLNTTAASHRVWLAVLSRHPVNLEQWRAARSLAHRWLIDPPSGAGNLKTIQDWIAGQTFATILCASPRVWPAVAELRARLRLCDCAWPGSETHLRRACRARGLRRFRHHQRRRVHAGAEAGAAREADIIIVAGKRAGRIAAQWTDHILPIRRGHEAALTAVLTSATGRRSLPGSLAGDSIRSAA